MQESGQIWIYNLLNFHKPNTPLLLVPAPRSWNTSSASQSLLGPFLAQLTSKGNPDLEFLQHTLALP